MSNTVDQVQGIGFLAIVGAGLFLLWRYVLLPQDAAADDSRSWICRTLSLGCPVDSDTGYTQGEIDAMRAVDRQTMLDVIAAGKHMEDMEKAFKEDPSDCYSWQVFDAGHCRNKTDAELCSEGDVFFCNKAEGMKDCGNGIQVSQSMPCPAITPITQSPWTSSGGCMARLFSCPSGWSDTGLEPISGLRCCIP